MTYKYNTVNNTAKSNTNLDYTIDLRLNLSFRGLIRMITSIQF